ncbi:BA75_04624T0 [Komagataella pastoris]|uniref:BA75_04624T0 n=1 Tax=Komagataella pastoris TaxID=4922 RepID=A0A1B2JH98_PICPA|nr:BA75_04624T0 [Komagataella pastoris]
MNSATDSITHKKPIKIKTDISNNRRKALKEFYKLRDAKQKESEAQQSDQTTTRNNSEDVNNEALSPDTTTENEKVPVLDENFTEETFDTFLKNADIGQLVNQYNVISEDLNNTKAEVKSIIYNNYYELIKINDVLENVRKLETVTTDTDSLDSKQESTLIIDSLNSIRSNIQLLKDRYKGFSITIDENEKKKSEMAHDNLTRLISGDKLTDEDIRKIDEVLPKINKEALLLQLNEIKDKAGASET